MTTARLTHTELQQHIVDLLNATGWQHLHVRRSVGRGKKWATTTNIVGWPDLFCWSTRQPGRHIAIEVKVTPDWLSEDQAQTLVELSRSGVESYVVFEPSLQRLAQMIRPRAVPWIAGEVCVLNAAPASYYTKATLPTPVRRARAPRR